MYNYLFILAKISFEVVLILLFIGVFWNIINFASECVQ
jgi:hypothetical protein